MTPDDKPTQGNGDGAPEMDAKTLAGLERLARSTPRSGREAVAKLGAIRTLERLARSRRVAGVSEWQWPSETPDAPAGPDFWPYCCSPAHHNQEAMRELDAGCSTHGDRDRWRRALEGAPPWRHPPG